MDVIEVVEAGLLTMVEDLGRFGFQKYGVTVSGAMDTFALRAGNGLVGNAEGEAGLEMTLLGPRLLFLRPAIVALTGADLEPRLNDRPCPMWHAFAVTKDDTLSFDGKTDGVRAYLAVKGGIDVPLVLNSRSTYTRSKLGGVEGRPLRPGDRLRVGGTGRIDRALLFRLAPARVPRYGTRHALRVVLGPQHLAFTDAGIRTFLGNTYKVTPQSDRIGYRLQGPSIEHKGSPDIVSDGSPLGAVQVAGDGMPIILLADRGTTGGYTKIATVIGADLPQLAQASPGDEVVFRSVSLEEAHQALAEEDSALATLELVAEMERSRRLGAPLAAAAAAVQVALDDAQGDGR